MNAQKVFAGIAVGTLLMSASLGTVMASEQKRNVDLMSAPFGTGTYVLGNALEQITKKTEAPVSVNSTETPGLVFNRKKLAREPDLRSRTIIAQTGGVDYLARNGEKPFTERHPPIMIIGNYNLASAWLATFDKNIRTPQDLVGKRIALGRAPQILWTIEPRLIIRHGWELEDKINIQMLGTKQAGEALLNGSVDAAIVGGYVNPNTHAFMPSPQTVELMAAGRPLYHIPWGADAVRETQDAGVPISPLKLPAQAMEGLDQPLLTFFDAVAWSVYPEFDEQSAYELTKTIIQNVDKFSEYHALGKLMTKDSLVQGWPVDRIHPGALRAYREAGILE